MWRCLIRLGTRDSLNAGSSMTLGSKGCRPSPAAHRARMPWTASKEYVPGVVLHAKERVILDGTQLVENDQIDRSSQIDPLAVLQSAVAQYRYHTSTGKNIFQLVAQLPGNGRGRRLYRAEWMEGTYEKYITLSAIDFDRHGHNGTAYGYITFHGESTTRPVQIEYAEVPGWCLADRTNGTDAMVSEDEPVPPPPSIGTDVPVNPREYRLKAYPYYDAPNPASFVERLLKDRGVLPDVPMHTDGVDATMGSMEETLASGMHGRGDVDGSQHYTPPQ